MSEHPPGPAHDQWPDPDFDDLVKETRIRMRRMGKGQLFIGIQVKAGLCADSVIIPDAMGEEDWASIMRQPPRAKRDHDERRPR